MSIEVKHFNYRNICDLGTTQTKIQNTTRKEMLDVKYHCIELIKIN